ncbi:MAG: hypothetical protein R3A80_01000 [Bdellovibrionota bacterium]
MRLYPYIALRLCAFLIFPLLYSVELEVHAPMLPQDEGNRNLILSQEKIVFDFEPGIRSFDPEEAHVWAAKKWVEAITSPAESEEAFISLIWVNGQQIAALQRQNKIYVTNKGSPKYASMVFEKEIEKELKKYCQQKEDADTCLATLKEKALKLTEIFWGDYKKKAAEDFKRNGLNENRIGFDQIRGHIREAFQDRLSDAWISINDYVTALKGSSLSPIDPDLHKSGPVRLTPFILPPKEQNVGGVNLNHKRKGLRAFLDETKEALGLKPKIEEVPEERKAWNYVSSESSSYDLYRASSRYTDQVVRSLGCAYFEESSLLNGQIISRLLRKGSMDVAQLTDMTNDSIESWCYQQFSQAEQILECKKSISPLFAELNKYYWQSIKAELGKDGKKLSSYDVDVFFENLRKTKAIQNPDHPLGKIHADITSQMEKLKGRWGYRCLSKKGEALGDYRFVKAADEARAVTDSLLKGSLLKYPLRSPPAMCARAVKGAMQAAGIFRTYPGWGNATSMANGFEYENRKHIHLNEGYELKKIETMNPEEAPAYAIIVYGNGNGHVEQKIPTSELAARGIKQMLAYGNKRIDVEDREFAYVSDYIDSAPRNSPKSRLARGDGGNNGRPVLGIYVIMRKS